MSSDYVRLLGWDPAYKSLAYAYIEVRANIRHDMEASMARLIDAVEADPHAADTTVDMCLREIISLIDTFIRGRVRVDNILGDLRVADVPEQLRTRRLKSHLNASAVSERSLPIDTIVCIERQPTIMCKARGGATSGVSNIACAQLGHYYSNFTVYYISPKRKHALEIGGNKLADFGTGYVARKRHSSAMMHHLVSLFNVDIGTVSAANFDDAADATMTALVYLAQRDKRQ